MKYFEFGFHFTNGIISSEIGFEFLNKQVHIQQPRRFVQVQECGSKQSNAEPFRKEKNIVDHSCIVLKKDLDDLGNLVCVGG